MPSKKVEGCIYQFRNCHILSNHKLIREDLWVRNGKILNPEKLFFDEKAYADKQIDCQDNIIAPGYIDVQINGAFGVDFSDTDDIVGDVSKVAKGLLEFGVTSFCPTVITSPPEMYQKIVQYAKKTEGSLKGAGVLGLHLEGPFINTAKKGAHNAELIRDFKNGFQDVVAMYGDKLEGVAMVTLAPELERSSEVIQEFCRRGIKVSIGHSTADLVTGETAIKQGACMVTHLFNAMVSFHHRDPHLIGILTSNQLPTDRTLFYGLIADGIHTHPSALRIAHRVHPSGLVLVTDAIIAMGLPEGKYKFGNQNIEIHGKTATIAGTNILSGSIAKLDYCVRNLLKNTECGIELALECASLHPAQALGITDRKGTLDYGTDADFIILDPNLNVLATYIAGEKVWEGKTMKGQLQ
ncbi:N-acetylglucosamine-6-phosphate deacetylase-like [Mya arenaria]|uniref:N-acetylglucosamine-6-phosphate deacetylase-like n=1 Tax=Mya arenaria TaxID=6604 RepID=UPI0022E5486D|nr:N-acetylglucosamine-6-phosphate deacetylase-like [Mya arenaria]XP_052794768.1 N-acetylglucosamine-6-phosphate deacetylase-like [Mya arenaria]